MAVLLNSMSRFWWFLDCSMCCVTVTTLGSSPSTVDLKSSKSSRFLLAFLTPLQRESNMFSDLMAYTLLLTPTHSTRSSPGVSFLSRPGTFLLLSS